MRRLLVMMYSLLAPLASGLAPSLAWAASATPTAALLAAGKEAGSVRLWGSVQPRARQVALWELKLFFKAEDDMQKQLGLTSQKDQDDTFALIAGIAVAGVIASSAIEASELPQVAKVPLGVASTLAPFLALLAGVAVPQQLQLSVTSLRRLLPEYRRCEPPDSRLPVG